MSAVYQDEAERQRVEAALRDMGVAHRGRGARPAPRPPEPEARFGPVFAVRNNIRMVVAPDPHGGGPPIGAVDLCSLHYENDRAAWEKGARIMDVAATVERQIKLALDTVGQHIGKTVGRLEKKIAAVEDDNKALRRANDELQGELADLVRQVALIRATRGHTDGQQLASALPAVQRKPRAASKRKLNGSSPGEARL